MKHFHGIYKLYSRTGASLIVILVLIGAVMYSLLSPGTGKKTTLPDVKIVGSQKQQNTLFKTQDSGCSSDGSIDSSEQQLITLINQYRSQNGLAPVSNNSILDQTANWMANDMATHHYISHTDSLGRIWSGRLSACGYTALGVDILAKNSSSDPNVALNQFKTSPEHNIVILNQVQNAEGGANIPENWTEIGVARAQGSDGWYWAVYFGLGSGGSSGGGITPPPSSGGSTCTCANGLSVEGVSLTADCGVKVCGQDSQKYLCESQDNWVGQGDTCQSSGECYEGQIINDVTGAILSTHYIGYNGQPVCGKNKQNYICQNGTWTPQNSSCGPGSGGDVGITPPSGGGGNGGGGGITPPPNTQYTLSVTLDKTTVNPGDRINLCYNLTPQGIAYHIKLLESNLGGAFVNVGETNDDGVGGGDCLFLNLDAAAVPGSRVFKVEAYINGQKVAEGSATTTVNATNTTPTVPTGATPTTIIVTTIPTGAISPTSALTPTETPTAIPTVPGETITPTLAPGNVNLAIILPGIAGNTSLGENPTPVSATQTGNVEITGAGQNVTFNFVPSNFTFQTQIGTNINTAIKVRTENSLWKEVGALTTPTKLVTGDLNQDNELGLFDYNIFLACYGQGSCPQKGIADLNLDGKVDEKDLNIFYSGLANRQGD